MVKANINLKTTGEVVTISVNGNLDESTKFMAVKIVPGSDVSIDTGAVKSINSFGAREWILWMRDHFQDLEVKFVNCAPVFIDYVNMISGFMPPKGKITSFNLPYFCGSCGETTLVNFASPEKHESLEKFPDVHACAQCKNLAEIDVVVSTFFQFLKKND